MNEDTSLCGQNTGSEKDKMKKVIYVTAKDGVEYEQELPALRTPRLSAHVTKLRLRLTLLPFSVALRVKYRPLCRNTVKMNTF
jgi:hypothetical protein